MDYERTNALRRAHTAALSQRALDDQSGLERSLSDGAIASQVSRPNFFRLGHDYPTIRSILLIPHMTFAA